MQTVVLGGKTVVVGLSWSVISKAGAGRSKDIQKAKEENGLLNGVVVENEEIATVGLGSKKADLNSAAAWAAVAYQDNTKALSFGDSKAANSWIIVESIPGSENEGKYWLCAISEGLPVPGTDVVEDLTVISAKLAELIEILENVDIYSPDKEIQEYVADVSPAIDKGLAQIVESVGSYKSKIQKIGGVPDWAIPAGIAAGLAVVGYFGWDFYSDYDKRQKTKEAKSRQDNERRMADQQRTVQASKEYQDKLKAAKEKAFGEVLSLLSMSPAPMALAWTNSVYGIPLNNGGWRLETVSCDAGSCKVAVTRDSLLATNASLMDKVEKMRFPGTGKDEPKSPTVEISADSGSYSIPVSVVERVPNIETLPTVEQFERHTVSQLQRLRLVDVDVKIGGKKDVTFTPPIPPGVDVAANPELKPKPVRIGVAQGELILSGKDLWMVKELASILNRPEFSFTSIDVAVAGISTSPWVIKGWYLLKSQSDPMPGEASADGTNPNPSVTGGVPKKKKEQGWWDKITGFFS